MSSAEEIYLFRHAAYRDVAYRLQLPTDRAELHAHALEIMEDVFAFDIEKFSQELADHARLAREYGASNATSLANREARYLSQAIARAQDRAQWAIVLMLTDHALQCPALDAPQRMDSGLRRARALRETGRVGEAEKLFLEVAMSAADHGDTDVQLQAAVDGAAIRIARGELEAGISVLERAEQLAKQEAGEGRPEHLASIYLQRSLAATNLAEVQQWLDEASQTIGARTESSMYGAIQGNIANHLGARGEHDEAIKLLRRLAEVFAAKGETRNLSIAWANVGRQELLRGGLDGAEEPLAKAIQYAIEVGNARTEAFARANMATLSMRRGAFERARVNINRAIEIARDHELHSYLASYLCIAAELKLLIGHAAEAQADVENARAEFNDAGGAAFIVEYCGLVRVRIAVAQSVAISVPGRATSRLTAAPPSATWLHIVRQLVEELRQESAQRTTVGPMLQQGLVAGAALLAELETAVAEKRPALVFRGHLPTEMGPELRDGLVGRLAEGERASLKTLHPALWEALNEGARISPSS